MDEFLSSYIEAALWSSIDSDSEDYFNYSYSSEDLAEKTLKKMRDDCEKFIELNKEDIKGRESQAGHDFWLTRNGHGCGFWETYDWEKEKGERLTKSARSFKECYLCVGDDGKIYCE